MAEWLKVLAWKASIPKGIEGSNPSPSSVNRVNVGRKKANCFAFVRDEKDGVMFREYVKPRVGVAEIYERRRVNYL